MGILDFFGDLALPTGEAVLASVLRSNFSRMSSSFRVLVEVFENFLVGETAMSFFPDAAGLAGAIFLDRAFVFWAAVLDFSSVTAGSMVCLRTFLAGLTSWREMELLLDLVVRLADWSNSNTNFSPDVNSSSSAAVWK